MALNFKKGAPTTPQSRGKVAGAPAQAAQAGGGASGAGQSTRKVISLKPSDQQSGGLLDDVDVMLTDHYFCEWDYNGTIQQPIPALHVTMTTDDGTKNDQYYSCGDMGRMVPSQDGQRLEQVEGSNSTGLNNNTNAGKYLASLVEHGFPEEKFDEVAMNVNVLDGMYAHILRVAQGKRAGLANQKDNATVAVVSQIHKLPWETKGKGTTAAPKNRVGASGRTSSGAPPATASATASTNGDAVNDEAAAALIAVLKEKGEVGQKQVGMLVFRALGQSPNRSAILNLVSTDDFLTQDGAPWIFDPAKKTIEADPNNEAFQ